MSDLNLESLPDFLLLQVALTLPLDNILSICSVNQNLNGRICGNENFWQSRFIQDFGESRSRSNISWKDQYMKLFKQELWVWGEEEARDPRNYHAQIIKHSYPGPIKLSSGVTDIALNCCYLYAVILGKLYQKKIFYSAEEEYQDDFELAQGLPSDRPIIQVSSFDDFPGPGYPYLLVLDDQGKVYYQSLDRPLSEMTYFTENNIVVKQISTHFGANLALDSQNIVYIWGSNVEEDLGISGPEQITEPVPLTYFQERNIHLRQILAGWPNFFLTDQGHVYYMGNSNGVIYREPTPIEIPVPIKHMSRRQRVGGTLFGLSAFLGQDRKVYVFGDNHISMYTVAGNVLEGIESFWAGESHNLLEVQSSLFPAHIQNQLGPKDTYLSEEVGWTLLDFVNIPNFKHLIKGKADEKFRAALIEPQDHTESHRNTIQITFEQVASMLQSQRFTNMEIRETLPSGNVMMVFKGIDGHEYISEVQYDSTNNKIYPPG